MLFDPLPQARRHLLPRKTPWLFFHRDHPFRWDRIFYDEYDETFLDQEERFRDVLDDDDWLDDDT